MNMYKILLLMLLTVGGGLQAAYAEETVDTQAQVVQAQTVIAKVNINTAPAEELAAELKGIGIKKAQSIVAYREQFGPFKTANEVTDVKGIGKGILQRNHDRIVVE